MAVKMSLPFLTDMLLPQAHAASRSLVTKFVENVEKPTNCIISHGLVAINKVLRDLECDLKIVVI